MPFLKKNSHNWYVPGVTGSPSSPGRPYKPAWTETKTYWKTEYIPYVIRTLWYEEQYFVFYTDYRELDEDTGYIATRWVPRNEWGWKVEKTLVTERIEHPEQSYIPPTPGTPSTQGKVVYDYNMGWNASARSRPIMPGDGTLNFGIAPGATGVVIGLTEDISWQGSGYFNITHGMHFQRGQYRICESGAPIGSFVAFDGDDVFKIKREDEEIEYLVNDTVVYTSLVPRAGILVADCSLYMGGSDIIYNASMSDDGGWTPIDGDGGSESSLPPLNGFAGAGVHGESSQSLPPMEGSAIGGVFIVKIGGGNGFLPPMSSYGRCLTGGNGGSESSLNPLESLSGRAGYCESRSRLKPMTGEAWAFANPWDLPSNGYGEFPLFSVSYSSSKVASLNVILKKRWYAAAELDVQVTKERSLSSALDLELSSMVQLQASVDCLLKARATKNAEVGVLLTKSRALSSSLSSLITAKRSLNATVSLYLGNHTRSSSKAGVASGEWVLPPDVTEGVLEAGENESVISAGIDEG